MVPSINADGRAANSRGNSTGQDLNRDHALIEQNETKGFARMIRDYTPDVLVDNHEGDSEDLPILAARHLNVEESLFEEGKLMVNKWMYDEAALSGWWMGPYSTGGDSHEGILRNTGSLKNGVSMLGEARAAGGATRPAEGGTNSRANENRKVYAHLWENWEGLRYMNARLPQIRAVVANSIAAQTGNIVGRRTVLRGVLPVAAGAVGGREPERPARRRHAAAEPDPRSGAVRVLHPAGRVHDGAAARSARSRPAWPTTASRPSRRSAACSSRSSSRTAGWSRRSSTPRRCCR